MFSLLPPFVLSVVLHSTFLSTNSLYWALGVVDSATARLRRVCEVEGGLARTGS